MLSPTHYARLDDDSMYSDDELLPVTPTIAPHTVTPAHTETSAAATPTTRAPRAPTNSSSTATPTSAATSKLESIVTHVTKETLAQLAKDPMRKSKSFNIGYKPMKIKPKINALEGTKNYAQWSRRM